ncbi:MULTISPECIES: restriction endonuclease subunit S [Streptomyces]|uniref:restriction endonuclease subunit S n=1 Tax=Streptomyces TaxID=1883 RepID=UPI00099CEBAB|nr:MULTISPECIES: restriction endonuclease subunit S [Streptomyces]
MSSGEGPWPLESLGNLCRVSSGTTPSRAAGARYFTHQGIPWVKTLDLNEGSLHATDESLTDIAVAETGARIYPAKAVLLAMYGGWEQIGRTAILAVPAAVNQAISVLEVGPQLEPRYLLVALQHGRSRWSRYAASTRKDPNITKSDVLAFEVPVPSLPVQRQVVKVLDSFTKLERGIEASIAKFEALRSGLMEELAELECGQFGEVLKQGPQNGIYKPASSYGLQGTPIVRIDSFSRGRSDLTRGLLRVAVSGGEIARYGLEVGDIVINRVNTPDLVGKATSVRRLIEPTIFESNMMRCKLHHSAADPGFTETWLGSSTVKRYFLQRAKSAISQASINGDDVRDCPFPKMDVPGQLAFLKRLDAVEGQRMAEVVELAKLRQLKQGLVGDLLAGRVAVSVVAA